MPEEVKREKHKHDAKESITKAAADARDVFQRHRARYADGRELLRGSIEHVERDVLPNLTTSDIPGSDHFNRMDSAHNWVMRKVLAHAADVAESVQQFERMLEEFRLSLFMGVPGHEAYTERVRMRLAKE